MEDRDRKSGFVGRVERFVALAEALPAIVIRLIVVVLALAGALRLLITEIWAK